MNKTKRTIGWIAFYIFVVAFVLVLLLPFIWQFLTSVKPLTEIAAMPAKWTPSYVHGDFYVNVPVKAKSAIGRTIKELDVRARTGASIVSIVRGDERIRNPGPGWRFAKGDEVMAIGEPGQLSALRRMLS